MIDCVIWIFASITFLWNMNLRTVAVNVRILKWDENWMERVCIIKEIRLLT